VAKYDLADSEGGDNSQDRAYTDILDNLQIVDENRDAIDSANV